jgi:hypothetical protein
MVFRDSRDFSKVTVTRGGVACRAQLRGDGHHLTDVSRASGARLRHAFSVRVPASSIRGVTILHHARLASVEPVVACPP